MPFTSFTAKFSYSQSTHKFVFDHNNLYIKLKSDNSTVKTFGLGGVVDIRINGGCIQTGTINGLSGSFSRYLDFTLTDAGITYDEDDNKIIGTNDTNNSGVTKYNYVIGDSNCPVRIVKNTSTSEVTITCPCDLSNCSTLNSGFYQQN
jgi:hypothetical protein